MDMPKTANGLFRVYELYLCIYIYLYACIDYDCIYWLQCIYTRWWWAMMIIQHWWDNILKRSLSFHLNHSWTVVMKSVEKNAMTVGLLTPKSPNPTRWRLFALPGHRCPNLLFSHRLMEFPLTRKSWIRNQPLRGKLSRTPTSAEATTRKISWIGWKRRLLIVAATNPSII